MPETPLITRVLRLLVELCSLSARPRFGRVCSMTIDVLGRGSFRLSARFVAVVAVVVMVVVVVEGGDGLAVAVVVDSRIGLCS